MDCQAAAFPDGEDAAETTPAELDAHGNSASKSRRLPSARRSHLCGVLLPSPPSLLTASPGSPTPRPMESQCRSPARLIQSHLGPLSHEAPRHFSRVGCGELQSASTGRFPDYPVLPGGALFRAQFCFRVMPGAWSRLALQSMRHQTRPRPRH